MSLLLTPIIPFLTTHTENPSFMGYLLHSNVFNFTVVVLFLGWVIRKFNLLASIDTQQTKITQEVKSSEQAKTKALEELEAIQKRTAHIQQEVDEILKTARHSADALSAQILQEAQMESVKIVEMAKKRIELEQQSAVKQLEARLLHEVIQETREQLTQTITPKLQERSVETFLEELPAIVASGERK